ncbi:putative ubiquitin-like-specific protease 1B [Exaiptasia diaphana]|uniref:Ubiquitin-like protease family profile domain-containing protein n=1 Tax=Exaiptasia diaphana TaxID=2652724 RepID=A0A913X1W7_EXADI|nr:putative ubiquitin-like-specific protease 1B [Exaiptasia diaphana]
MTHLHYRSFLKCEAKRRNKQLDLDLWVDETPKNIPHQDNDYDCGVFMCMYIESLSRCKYPSFNQSDMGQLRLQMKNEILSRSLVNF